MAKAHARNAAERARIVTKYGLSDEATFSLSEILAAELRISNCERCDGAKCLHELRGDWWLIPELKVSGGELWVDNRECRYKLYREVERLSRLSKLPEKYAGKTFDDYEVTANNANAVKGAKWFLAQKKPPKGLYVYGGVGAGKTFLVSLIAAEYLKQRRSVIFGDVPHLLDEIKATFDKGTTEELLEAYYRCELLVLDDLGAGLLTPWNIGQLYNLVNQRYNAGRAILVTSNLSPKEMAARFNRKEEQSGDRIVSRLRDMTLPIHLKEEDRRG